MMSDAIGYNVAEVKCLELEKEIAQLTNENAHILAKLQRAEAAGSEMKNCLRELKIRIAYIGMPQEPFWLDGERKIWDWRKQIALLERAISTQCGFGWLSPEKVKRLRKALDKLLVHSIEFYNDWKKVDFELPKLAQCDMRSMAEQFEPATQALAETEDAKPVEHHDWHKKGIED